MERPTAHDIAYQADALRKITTENIHPHISAAVNVDHTEVTIGINELNDYAREMLKAADLLDEWLKER